MMSISTTLFGKILHASIFITDQLRNPWQMLTEPWGSAEPRLKNTELLYYTIWWLKILTSQMLMHITIRVSKPGALFQTRVFEFQKS